MALTAVRCALALGAILLSAAPLAAQSVTTEADLTVGRSSEGVGAASTQVRVFGASRSDWRFFAEATLGALTGPESDAFASAYPYDRSLRPMEAYGEKMFRPGGYLVGVRAGRYRVPFGISGRADQAYSGFLRAPLVRYADNLGLSNMFLEGGVDVLAGRPEASIEVSAGAPADQGENTRRAGFDRVVRAQVFAGSFILGASYLHANTTQTVPGATGAMTFTGADVRWSHGGLEMRGEWMTGQPYAGTTTRGGYVDGIVHLRGMGPLTAVARIETLDRHSAVASTRERRLTAGARLRLFDALVAELNLVGQPGGLVNGRSAALDVGLTYSLRR